MKLGYTCSLYAVEFYEAINGDEATQTPSTMYGEFCYEGYDPFQYKVLFCPMGGVWTMIQVNGRWRPLSTRRNEDRYMHIGDSALSLACGLRESDVPEDFVWTLTHKAETLYSKA